MGSGWLLHLVLHYCQNSKNKHSHTSNVFEEKETLDKKHHFKCTHSSQASQHLSKAATLAIKEAPDRSDNGSADGSAGKTQPSV
jgi:hypothetical protein